MQTPDKEPAKVYELRPLRMRNRLFYISPDWVLSQARHIVMLALQAEQGK